ncbi:MAG: hypothetical protein JW891_12050 [Candidatus Lokiarchaeota archaeon]|nr:hypothetical protein [Candidatus Lokiarchaeota archaeon]
MESSIVISGTFSLIFIIVSFIIGLKIILGYKKRKERTYLYIGFVWILISGSWYASAISFLIALFTNGSGLQFHPEIYFLIGNSLVPVGQILWLIVTTDFFAKEKQILIVGTYCVFAVIEESFLIYGILVDPGAIGTLVSPVDVEYEALTILWASINLIIFIIPGFLLGETLLSSDNKEHHLKGKYLILAFILFGLGSILDALSFIPVWFLPITRIILISSSICYYVGFILPKWMRRFLKEVETPSSRASSF